MDGRSGLAEGRSGHRALGPVDAPRDVPAGRAAGSGRAFGRRLLLALAASLVAAVVAQYALATLGPAAGSVAGVGVGLVLFHLLVGRALTARYRISEELSLRDGLTGIGNHRSFEEELRRATAFSRRTGQPLSAAMFDIVGFKYVNDRFGHRHGDRVLREVAGALAGTRGGDHAFRIGGDEFAVLFPATAAPAAEEAVERIRQGVQTGSPGIQVRSGIGALGPGDDAEALWTRLDSALNQARRRGEQVVVVEGAGVPAPTSVSGQRGLRRLLEEERMGVAFQPIHDLEADRVLGYEALARPPADAELGGPAEAFVLAESLGRAPALDELCRRAILSRASELPHEALLFLNLSPLSLGQPALADRPLLAQIEAAGLSPERVVLEITERSAAPLTLLVEEVGRLRSLGFRVALDDVGAGNAGLEALRHLHVDFLKIDRGIVSTALHETTARALLRAIAGFALETGSAVVAEGVETEEMLELVRSLERWEGPGGRLIGAAQGFLLGRPSEGPPAGDPSDRATA